MLENIIIGIVSAIVGGLTVLIADRRFKAIDKKRELLKGNIPTNINASKVLTNDILESISPERSYLKVQEILGLPDKCVRDYSVFEDRLYDEEALGHVLSDIFFLKNATLKVTTYDKQSIYSVTVFSYDKNIKVPEILYCCEEYEAALGEARICKEIIDQARNSTPIRTMRDSSFAIQNYIGPPFYKYITYFSSGYVDNVEGGSFDDLLGREVIGFCLSLDEMAFYIYDYELR